MRTIPALCLLCGLASAQVREPIEFEPNGHDAVAAERVTFTVPERRAAEHGRVLKLRFVRFPSRQQDADLTPVVYLAGGPGGSGIATARGRRWPLFAALMQDRDVIAFDQRGTGDSDGPGAFTSSVGFPAGEPGTRALWTRLHREAMRQAVAHWAETGIDIRGYTTAESARDLDDLRQALGVERLSLLGISYGTHLALAYAKLFPDHVDRVVLVSPEGLDETVKLPRRTDAYFARLQAAIDAEPAAKARFPDVAGRIAAALARCDRDRPEFALRRRGSAGGARVLGRFDMQIAIGYSIADPDDIATLLGAIDRAADGDFAWFGRWLGWISPTAIRLRGMPEAMDLASGISAARLAVVEEQRRSALLDDALNFPMPHLRGVVGGLELDDAFRAPSAGDRPTLILSGTLDGRTYVESHQELAQRLEHGTLVTVENGGHNLFFDHPDVVPTIARFLAGEAAGVTRLVAPPPAFGAGR